MLVANALVTTVAAAVNKGDLIILNPNGTPYDTMLTPIDVSDKNAPYVLLNALGNGSFKKFEIYPNMSYKGQLSGSATNVIPHYDITYPIGNARTDSFGNQFEGGIVVKQWNENHNAYETRKILSVEVIGTNGTVANADVKVAFKAAMASITGTGIGKYITTATHTTDVSSVFNLLDTTYFIELIGDLRWWDLVKTNGSNLAVTGADAVKFEKELAPNSGYHHATELNNDLYAESNFIADASEDAYDIVSIFTSQEAQRALVLGSGGFITECHVYTPHVDMMNPVYQGLTTFLEALRVAE